MIISNNNYIDPTDKVCKFQVEFEDSQICKYIPDSIELLAKDDNTKVWQNFQGKFAVTLLDRAIEGLMVFLTCQRKGNILTGQFTSLDPETDGQLLTKYLHESNEDAIINIQQTIIAA